MKPEDKVVSLATAKKLKERGFPQDTYFFYGEAYRVGDQLRLSVVSKDTEQNWYAAPDAQEFQLQGKYHDDNGQPVYLLVAGLGKEGGMGFRVEWGEKVIYVDSNQEGVNWAEECAAAWLWLKEQGLLPGV